MYCDNIQWFDRDSWNLVVSLVSTIPERNWLCILNYTSNAEIIQISHYDFSSVIQQLKSDPHVKAIEINRLPKILLDNFCQEMLGLPIRISDDQRVIIYEYSKGVPYYIKTILQILKDSSHIILTGSEWVSTGNWNSEYIRETLKDCVKERITGIYRRIPGSRDALEIASVFGEEFKEETINELFKMKDSFSLLSSIEAKFRLILYLVEDRSWIFEHSLIQSYIYQSIGSKVKDLHLKIARCLENSGSLNFLKISWHFHQGGEQSLSTIYKLKEVEQLLISGCYNAAGELIDKISEDWLEVFSLSDAQKQEFEILKGKSKFHSVQYEASLEIFTSILTTARNDQSILALCHRWLGRIYLKLNSQSDFQSGLNHLEISREYYENLNSAEDLGLVYADLVVAYAHLNRIQDAEASFKKAERYFNITKNKIGMLRLQRRAVIFMDTKFTAVLLEKTGAILKNMELPNEYIMTINNSATQFIYIGELLKAKNILMNAMSVSSNIGGFGQVYIYNNLALISYVENELDEAVSYLNLGREGKYRHVEQLIIDINESVVLAKKMSADIMLNIFNRIYRKALLVNENDYVVPSGINYAKALGRAGNWSDAKKLLHEIKERISFQNNDYENYMWYTAMKECFDALGLSSDLLVHDENGLNLIVNPSLNNPFFQSDYALISMQFWSDN